MGLLDLVKKHYRVWLSAHRLCELSALVITDISRRRSHKTAYRVTLLILAHIDTGHHIFVIEEKLCQSLGQFGLSHARRSHEQERSYRPFLILQTGT